MLAANIPYFQVYRRVWRWQGDRRNVLADGGYGFQVGMRRRVCALDLLEECSLASVVKAEEENRVLWEAVR